MKTGVKAQDMENPRDAQENPAIRGRWKIIKDQPPHKRINICRGSTSAVMQCLSWELLSSWSPDILQGTQIPAPTAEKQLPLG